MGADYQPIEVTLTAGGQWPPCARRRPYRPGTGQAPLEPRRRLAHLTRPRHAHNRRLQPTWPPSLPPSPPGCAGLGDLALRIVIGSTSVPGLAAKDIIDVQVTVTGLHTPVLTALMALGYVRLRDLGRPSPPNNRGRTATGRSGFCAPVASASPICMCVQGDPTSATRSSSATICAPTPPPQPPTPTPNGAWRANWLTTNLPRRQRPGRGSDLLRRRRVGGSDRLADGYLRRLAKG